MTNREIDNKRQKDKQENIRLKVTKRGKYYDRWGGIRKKREKIKGRKLYNDERRWRIKNKGNERRKRKKKKKVKKNSRKSA